MSLQTYSDETLMRRLQNYDEKYFLNHSKSVDKFSDVLDLKMRDKAKEIAQELTNRGVFFSAVHLKINNY
jgi:hypothetical protein